MERICKNCSYYRESGYCSNSESRMALEPTFADGCCSEFYPRGKKAPLWMRLVNKLLFGAKPRKEKRDV